MARLEGSGRAKALTCTGVASESRAGMCCELWFACLSLHVVDELQTLFGASSAWDLDESGSLESGSW